MIQRCISLALTLLSLLISTLEKIRKGGHNFIRDCYVFFLKYQLVTSQQQTYLVKISMSFFLFLLGSESSSNSSISFPRNTSWWKSLLRCPSISIFTPFRWSGGRISFSSLLLGCLSLSEDIFAGLACAFKVSIKNTAKDVADRQLVRWLDVISQFQLHRCGNTIKKSKELI